MENKDKASKDTHDKNTKQDGSFLKKVIYLIVFGLLAVMFVTVNWEPITGTLSNATCAKFCHFLQPELKSWKKSAHSQLSCYSCHLEDFFFGFYKIGPGRIYRSVSNSFDKPINKDSDFSDTKLKSERCLKCHAVKNRKLSASQGFTMTREAKLKHLDIGMQCSNCHNRIAHKGAEKYKPINEWESGFIYNDYLKMKEGCWRCHSSKAKFKDEKFMKRFRIKNKPKTNCTTCHTIKIIENNYYKSCKQECHEEVFLKKLLKTEGI